MSFIKKLVGFLFEEEEEIEEEGELEEITIKEAPKPKMRTYEDESLEPIKPVHVESVPAQPVKKVEEKKFTSIEITEEKPASSRKSAEKATTTRKKVHLEQAKQEYEFTPVISPIFGASETSKKTEKQQNGTTSHPQRKTSTKKTSPYGEILSPMYGMQTPHMEPEEEEEKEHKQGQEEVQEKKPLDVPQMEDEREEETAIPLKELLCEEKTITQEDDLLQISLFGDDVIVRSEQQEDSYTIEE